jgi:hypothetical protein
MPIAAREASEHGDDEDHQRSLGKHERKTMRNCLFWVMQCRILVLAIVFAVWLRGFEVSGLGIERQQRNETETGQHEKTEIETAENGGNSNGSGGYYAENDLLTLDIDNWMTLGKEGNT